MKRNEDLEDMALRVAKFIKRRLDIDGTKIKKAIILGTGFGDALFLKNERSISLADINDFSSLRKSIPGHRKQLVAGEINNETVVVLKGRLHLNEDPGNPLVFKNVRLQTEMLIKLGATKIISTSAVGSLIDLFDIGDVVVVNGLVTLYAPQMPLWGGEFCSPEDSLSKDFQKKACQTLKKLGQKKSLGGHVMVLGPYFEGRKYDKDILAQSGAAVVGMSLLPEVIVAGLYPRVKVLGLCLVTNTADEVHDHKINLLRASKQKEKISTLLTTLIKVL